MDLSSRASSVYWCPWCVSSRCAGYARGLRPGSPHPVAGGHHPHCKRPRGAPPAHFPSDAAFVPRSPVMGAVACMLGSGARLVPCGTSIYNLAVHPPALLPARCVNIMSRHCTAVISWFTASCFGLVCQSCFLPRYLACRAAFDLGSMLPYSCQYCVPARCACLACLHSMAPPHPLYRTVLRPPVPPGTSGPTLD